MIQLLHGDCLEIMPTLADKGIDCVIVDPPYAINITQNDNREGGEWQDTPIDIVAFTNQVARVCKGFYAVFGQMPTHADWHVAAMQAGFHFCEHVVWVKRMATPLHRLKRGHESIYIYSAKGARKSFYETTGRYEDVKLAGMDLALVNIEGIDRHIKDLHSKLEGKSDGRNSRGGVQRHDKFNRGTTTDRSPRYCNFTNVWSFLPPGQAKRGVNYKQVHPTEKPLDIMTRLVKILTDTGMTVLDPCAGGGSTLVACIQENRNGIGIEKDDHYFSVAQERIRKE